MNHHCDYRVIYGDTDQMGVMYYANHLRLFECTHSRQFHIHHTREYPGKRHIGARISNIW